MAYSLLTHVGFTADDGGTTSAIDTTGATLFTLIQTWYPPIGTPVISDSQTNTWNHLTEYVETTGDYNVSVRLSYVVNPITNASHTFTVSQLTSAISFQVASWSGAILINPFDQENGTNNVGSLTSVQPGTVTPTQNNELLITGIAFR